MDKLSTLYSTIRAESIEVPVWEVLVILIVATLCMLLRGSKFGLLITYIFTLHMTFHFFQQHFSPLALLLIGIFGAIILLIGLFEALTER